MKVRKIYTNSYKLNRCRPKEATRQRGRSGQQVGRGHTSTIAPYLFMYGQDKKKRGVGA